MLNIDNVSHFYLDAIEFENEKLAEACEKLLVSKFDDIQAESRDFIIGIPPEQFISILKNDDLNIEHENTLVDLVRSYVAKRDAIPEEVVFGPPQETTPPEVWNLLSEDEKKVR